MDLVLRAVNIYAVDPYILRVPPPAWPDAPVYGPNYDPHYSLRRQFFVLWVTMYLGSLVLYFMTACTTYWLFFREAQREKANPDGTRNAAWWTFDGAQIRQEIFTSVWSLIVMTGMIAPIELWVIYGHGKVYQNISDYGWAYFLLSPVLFILFTDCVIYFIHRGLHLKIFYGPIHKMHHRYKHTTPFSAFSFHPLDGWLQGVPYHIFVIFFPMHNVLYSVSVFVVGWWTINIHDRVTLRLPGVNGAAHHTIHHTKFNYNYGQYFILWDWLMGSFKDPFAYPMYDPKFKLDPALVGKAGIRGLDEDPYPDETPQDNKGGSRKSEAAAAKGDAKARVGKAKAQ